MREEVSGDDGKDECKQDHRWNCHSEPLVQIMYAGKMEFFRKTKVTI
jgi:hypothetical protein